MKSLIIVPILFALYLFMAGVVSIGLNPDAELAISDASPNAEACRGENGSVPVPCWSNKPLSLGSTSDQYLAFFGGSDPGSYVKGAIDLARDGQTLREWIFLGYGTWPPGFFFVNAAAIKLDVPVGQVQWMFSAVSWALVFALVGYRLLSVTKNPLVLLVPVAIVMTPIFSDNFFRYGIVFSEAGGTALLCLGLVLITWPVESIGRKVALWCLAGFLVALGIYVRAQVYYVFLFMMAGFVLLALIAVATRRFRLADWAPHAAFFLAVQMTLMPYINLNLGKLYRIDFVFAYPFTLQEYPDAGAANWIAMGGMRSACVVDEPRCLAIRERVEAGQISVADLKSEIVGAFIRNPVAFVSHKAPIMFSYYFADNSYPATTVYRSAYWENLLYLGLFLVTIAYLLYRRDTVSLGMAGILVLMLCAVIAPPFAMHFEVRYLYLAKVLMLASPLLAMARHQILSFAPRRRARG
ncbi:hypothetical protein [Roseovarius sp.]